MIGAGEFIAPGSTVGTNILYIHKVVNGPHKGEITILPYRVDVLFTCDGNYDVDIVPVAEYTRTIDVEGIRVVTPVVVYHARLRG